MKSTYRKQPTTRTYFPLKGLSQNNHVLGFVLETKKVYKNFLLQLLALNKSLGWRCEIFNRSFFYTTNSLVAFNFIVNLLVELNNLHIVEPPVLQNIALLKAQTVALTRRLIWEEGLPVQKKFGSRYRRANKKRKLVSLNSFGENPQTLLDVTKRSSVYLNTNYRIAGDLHLRYIVWNKNLMVKEFFFTHFWQKPSLINVIVSFHFFVFFYFYSSIVNLSLLKLLTLIYYLKIFSINNAYYTSIVR